jgi:2-amino-4-hydroxy-6-hydroxymethyldihydropteridine diphosphokinase
MAEAFIGLGSNLQQPWRQLDEAMAALSTLPKTRIDGVSRRYRTQPVGPDGQPDFLNAVARLQTDLSPMALLAELQRIEDQQGRQRTERWGARTLDLDLLLFDQRRMETAALTLPHPRLHLRDFVLRPLAELAPDLVIYHDSSVRECLALLTEHSVIAIVDTPAEQPAL